jgi:hypothetical protein
MCVLFSLTAGKWQGEEFWFGSLGGRGAYARTLTFIHDISKIRHRSHLVPCHRAVSTRQALLSQFLVDMRVSRESVEDVADQDRRGLIGGEEDVKDLRAERFSIRRAV